MDENKPYRSGNGTGRPLSDGDLPTHVILSITRFRRRDNSEFLLSTGYLLAYNQYGDEERTPIDYPEKYTKVKFGFKVGYENMNNQLVPKRVNTGPAGSETVYTLPFTKENFKKIWENRRDSHIQLIVHDESGKKISVRNQLTSDETLKLFTENSFDYLYNAAYLTVEEKERLRNAAAIEGLIPRETQDETKAAVLAQQALSQKDKMASYG
jgi:hypothetical protein